LTVNDGADKNTGAMNQDAVIKKVVQGLYKLIFFDRNKKGLTVF
jgi:hypothetical protein